MHSLAFDGLGNAPQLREGDAKLKEQLAEEEDWLKEKLQRAVSRVQEQVAEMEKNTEEELQNQRGN